MYIPLEVQNMNGDVACVNVTYVHSNTCVCTVHTYISRPIAGCEGKGGMPMCAVATSLPHTPTSVTAHSRSPLVPSLEPRRAARRAGGVRSGSACALPRTHSGLGTSVVWGWRIRVGGFATAADDGCGIGYRTRADLSSNHETRCPGNGDGKKACAGF